MTLRLLAAIAAAGVAVAGSPADANEGWYISGQAGLSSLTDSKLEDPTVTIEVESDLGFSVSGAVGYRWGKFRVEGETAFSRSSIDQLKAFGIGISGDGDISAISFMANAFRDFDIRDPWSANIGGGIGVARVEFNDVEIAGVPLGGDDDIVFAYQLGAGIGYQITRSTTLTADYRYFSTLDPEFNDTAGTAIESKYDSHIFRIGVRYAF
ncbi:MAG: outer membrane beta-barrel protein [Alphaproteobacteria bacterium]